MFSPISFAIRIKMRLREKSSFTANVARPGGEPIKILNVFRNASRYVKLESEVVK